MSADSRMMPYSEADRVFASWQESIDHFWSIDQYDDDERWDQQVRILDYRVARAIARSKMQNQGYLPKSRDL